MGVLGVLGPSEELFQLCCCCRQTLEHGSPDSVPDARCPAEHQPSRSKFGDHRRRETTLNLKNGQTKELEGGGRDLEIG